MALRVQLHNRRLLAGLLLFYAAVATINCAHEEVRIVKSNEHVYFTKAGVTYVDSLPYSGVVYDLYPNSDTMFVYSFMHGKQEGRNIEWYPSGRLKEVRWYHDNRKEGVHKGWYENGKLKFVANYRRDIYDGSVKEWLESGQLFKDFHYKNGQEAGAQRMYWADGKIRANYQCINGRNYGLTGVKNCVSVWADSVGH